MKKIITFLLIAFLSKALIAQNYNPFVNNGTVAPAPLITGFGICSFNIGNSGSDPIAPGTALSNKIRVNITLSYGQANNLDPIAALGGTFKSKFDWVYTYDALANTFSYAGIQNATIGGNEVGTITIDYRSIQESDITNPQNGFNVNITPPAYTNPQPTGDDAVSSYTYGPSAGALPVKLISFDASVTNCVTTLNWKSATEENFSNYQVEYSKDGRSFQTIATVNGRGDNSTYSITRTSDQGKAYYRLKMVDVDNEFEYSRVIALNISCGKRTLLIFPNPASNVLNVNITGADNNGTRAILFNAFGQVILRATLQNGSNQLDISKAASGIYELRLSDSNNTENHKVVIVN